jgi:hypothetical protein
MSCLMRLCSAQFDETMSTIDCGGAEGYFRAGRRPSLGLSHSFVPREIATDESRLVRVHSKSRRR